jgi:hypothetical protein
VEDRISGLKDNIDIKEIIEEHLQKRLQICKKNVKELCDSTRRPNLASEKEKRYKSRAYNLQILWK